LLTKDLHFHWTIIDNNTFLSAIVEGHRSTSTPPVV
jgi:hypothetical protein